MTHPKDADQPQDVESGGVDHEREEAGDDHEHVEDVPPAAGSGGPGGSEARGAGCEDTRSG